MKLCVETSTTFDDWVRQSEKDYQDMLVYLKENDFAKVGELTEENALAMHATTKQHHQPFLIWRMRLMKPWTLFASYVSKERLVTLLWMLVPMSRSSVRRKTWSIYQKSSVNVIAWLCQKQGFEPRWLLLNLRKALLGRWICYFRARAVGLDKGHSHLYEGRDCFFW